MAQRPPVRTVLVLHAAPEDFGLMLDGRFPSVRFAYAAQPDDVLPMLERERPEVVFSIKQAGFPGRSHRPALDFPTVVWFHVGGSGYEHILPWDPERVTVTNAAGLLARFLAETVTGAVLALNGHFPAYLAHQRCRLWRAIPFRPLCEQTLLIVGLGEIGGRVAANAKALGMRVLAIRRKAIPHPAVDALYPPEALLDVLGQADVVSIHVRLDERTRRLMDAQAFAAMKRGAFFLNTSRGAVVDEPALIVALKGGLLAGAYLDVFETEPLPAESPLWDMQNVLITPHASDHVGDWPRRFAAHFADNLDRWLAGAPLSNVVVP